MLFIFCIPINSVMYLIDKNRPWNYRPFFGTNCLQIDWELLLQNIVKDVQDLPEEFWNPLMVYDTTYFQNLAAILASTKTESIRKLLYCNVQRLSGRLTARTVSVLQLCPLFQCAECHSVHTVWTTLRSTRRQESILIYCKYRAYFLLAMRLSE